jgi:hypothetical protein
MTRYSVLFSFFLSALFAAKAGAEISYSEANGSNEGVIHLTITPAPVPVPTLRYRLLQRDLDLKPGNAAPYYYRAQLEFEPKMKALREKFKEETELDQWYVSGADATPIDKLPLDKVRQASKMFDPIYDESLKTAFERSRCDWQLNIEELKGPDIISLHLGEFQGSRQLARMISLRTRLAIADRRYDDALTTMRENYRLGRDVAKVPFLVCGLIGIAIDQITNRSLLELIASPDSPNLYWALGQLPTPPIDLRPAVHFEMDFGPRMFPFIHNAETTDHTPQEWNRLLTLSLHDLQIAGSGGPFTTLGKPGENDVQVGLMATGLSLTGYTRAKERLIAEGMDRTRIEKMPVGQVIAIYTERTYHRFADDWENLWQVSYPDANKMAQRLEKKLEAARPLSGSKDSEILPMVSMLLPAVSACRAAEVRLERDVAGLRVIEALRMYAADHNGQLPSRLADIEDVPVPMNPATGKPFVYRLEGAKAILELPPSDQVAGSNYRYEIQVAAKK